MRRFDGWRLGAALLLSAMLGGCGERSGSDREAPATDGGARRDAAAELDAGGEAPRDGGIDDGAVSPDGSLDLDAAAGPGDPDAGAPPVDAGPLPCERRRVDTSSPPEGASWRFGGGVGYPDRPPSTGDCVTHVRDRAELEAALASASPGDVVFVAGDARIDLTGASLCIPAGVTLASDRGLDGSAGALLYVTRTENRSTLRVCGDDVRITGLRLFGHEPTECPVEWSSPDHRECTGDVTGATNCRDCMPRSRGITVQDADRLEVDNCELAGWTYGAIEIVRSHDDHVHHNEIHHNQRQGLGYGVVLSGIGNPGNVVIHHNRFDYNRHSVAGSGAIGQSYVAHDNLVLEHANGHVFDMHGISESASYDPAVHGPIDVAGTDMRIFRNTVLPTDQWALVVRGQPTEGVWLYDNCLARSSTQAARQTRYTGRFHVDRSPSGAAPNRYGQSASACLPVRFCASAGGAGPWSYLATSSYGLSSLRFGDFDGDGRTDVLRAEGTTWHWLPGGNGRWQELRTGGAPLAEVALGDFDGDGRTDAFRTTGSEWQVSRGGSGAWTRWNTSSAPLSSLRFGDFDGDGRTDVLRMEGGAWVVSYGGSERWATLREAGVPLAEVGFGDFDGDGRTDVFRPTGSTWEVAFGGTSAWTRINTSGTALSALRFGDFDGDGRTDVLTATGSRWNVSWGGRSGWQPLAFRSESLGELGFGDFDGDGRTDVLRTGCL